MVAPYYILAILALGLSLFSGRSFADAPARAGLRVGPRDTVLFAALCVALCVTFALQTAVTDRAVLHQALVPDWFDSALPLKFFAPDPPFSATANRSLVEWAQALSVVQSLVLLAIFGVMRRADCRRLGVVIITLLTAACLAAVALRSLTTSVDLYFYIAHALDWPHQYAPLAVRLPGDDSIINSIWGTPLLPSPYGPLWSIIAAGAVAMTHSLWQQVLAMRLLGLAAIATCTFCVYRVLGPSVATILFALNPALYGRYLIRAHNDLTGVAFILLAYVVRRHVWLAILLVAAAGTIKLPLILSGIVVFWDRPSLKERLWPSLSAGALWLAASLAFGGKQYFDALGQVYAGYDHAPPLLQQALHLTLCIVAVAAVGLALWRQRFSVGVGWSFPSLGQYPLSQYLAWSLPYVLLGFRESDSVSDLVARNRLCVDAGIRIHAVLPGRTRDLDPTARRRHRVCRTGATPSRRD